MSMSLPLPAVPLVDSCSTIYNNTLYTYSADAFQALPLHKGGTWERLPGGVSVTGGVCVHVDSFNELSPTALYIVGGNANSTQTGYQGLQRFVFEEKSWESISLSSPVTQSRLNHNAIYLNASSSIFIYAGHQDGSQLPSSDTFTISTMPPYEVRSYPSIAPLGVSPMLLTWSNSQAAMIGGSDWNTKVMLFQQTGDPLLSWEDSQITLDAPIKNDGTVKAAIVTGDDGSKSLYTFDMTVLPNKVNRILLVDQNGAPVSNPKPVKARVRHENEADSLTATNWPAYNGSLAPKTTRTKYSIAQDPNDRIIFSGGNEDDVLCMFQARENCWENAAALLAKSQIPIGTENLPSSVSTASTAPTISQTTSPSATSAASATAGSSAGLDRKWLGIIIGSVVGFIVVLLALIFCLKRRHKQRKFAEAGHQRRASGIPDEKDPMDFVDRGISYDTSRRYQGHVPNHSQASFSSMAILMGKVSSQPQGLGRRNGSNASDASSDFNKNYKSTISKPIPQVRPAVPANFSRTERPIVVGSSNAGPIPRPRGVEVNRQGSTRRSSGWNRYWSGGSALNVLGFGNKRATYGSQSDQGSMYSETEHSTRTTQKSAVVPPLNFGPPQGRLSQVASGSPTIAHQAKGSPLEQGMAGKIERPHSVSSVSSYGDNNDPYSKGIPSSIIEEHTWTPVGHQGWNTNRVPSSAYTDSTYAQTPRATIVENADARYPDPPRHKGPQHSSDMSWLNLGDKH